MAPKANKIDRLDYHRSTRPLLSTDPEPPSAPARSSFFDAVAESIQDMDRKRKTREVVRYCSFIWALLEW